MLTANAYAVKQVHQPVQDLRSQAASKQDTDVGTPWLNAVMVVDYQALPEETKPRADGNEYSSSTTTDTPYEPLPAKWDSAIPKFGGSL